MNLHQYEQLARSVRWFFAFSLALLGGCAEWSSTPARVQAHYGASVRSLVNSQIYNPYKAHYPATLLPDGLEGNKAESELEGVYRPDIGKPADVRRRTTIGATGTSSQ
ncbi:MAG: hypothetical protein PHE55_19720 [Methylococcaceae bacterium]|nr:hypothetical protein [Methylococcaceae bacterium]